MGLVKTIGGDRLGSGNKMKTSLHNYERSTHDLGNVWRSTMAPGVLVPFYKKICQKDDTWTINLKELVRTMPAIGPLLGSYKLQLDVFECPIRLYNGILHNNMTKIGMQMNLVKMPKMTLTHVWKKDEEKNSQVNPSSLLHYLGLRGISGVESEENTETITREINNIVPILAYYDIFKNYYANKQEENAYVITQQQVVTGRGNIGEIIYMGAFDGVPLPKISQDVRRIDDGNTTEVIIYPYSEVYRSTFDYYIPRLLITEIWIEQKEQIYTDVVSISFRSVDGVKTTEIQANQAQGVSASMANNYLQILLDRSTVATVLTGEGWTESQINASIIGSITFVIDSQKENAIKLQPFPLDNIDKMRVELLKNTTLGTAINITTNESTQFLPYSANWSLDANGNSMCANKMAGLCVKTYQSDIYNNWLSSKWIDGINGVNTISAVAVEEGKIQIDAINLAKKVYNMLNRIAISDGTYESWQEAVYGGNAYRHVESPVYCGGASAEIVFEEVVSTADTDTAEAGDQPLGSLAGKGTITDVKGGQIEIHVSEPAYIMGIVSITPRLDYMDGNDFDLTEIDSLNDLHKPELDQIGFQDLMLERAAYWGRVYDTTGETPEVRNTAGGKLPAWIEYMTSVNEVHGDFADELRWMVLARDYEQGNALDNNADTIGGGNAGRTIPVKDWTTYINPTKFNYQFANNKLDAQNFWVQIGINAICRRKISAKLIPNL